MAKAVLFHPPIDNIPLVTLPLAYLQLATGLAGSAHQLELVDGRVTAEPMRRLLEVVDDADLLLITSMPGSQITNARSACAQLRAAGCELPIVWGGTFPTLDPRVALADEHVSAVFAGRGERTLGALLDAVDAGRPLWTHPQVWAVDADGELHAGELEKPDMRPPWIPDIGRLIDDIEPYVCQTRRSRRMLDYISSFGCPHRCSFCSEPMTSRSRWAAQPGSELIDAITCFVERHELDGVLFQDAKFSARRQRVQEFCAGLIERELGIHWVGTACGADIDSFHESGLLEQMKRSGCEQLFIGAEAASPATLQLYHKTVDGEESYRIAKLLWEQYEILPHFSYVLGHPIESLNQIERTLALHEAICDLIGAPTGELGLYNPVPGSAFLTQHRQHFIVPERLAGWGRFSYSTQDLHQQPSAELKRLLFRHHVKIRRKFPDVPAHVSFDVWQEQYLGSNDSQVARGSGEVRA